jgi:hypothetical protein
MNSGGSSSFWFHKGDAPGWQTEIDVSEIGGKAKGFEHKVNITVHVWETPGEKKHWQVGGAWIAPWRLPSSTGPQSGTSQSSPVSRRCLPCRTCPECMAFPLCGQMFLYKNIYLTIGGTPFSTSFGCGRAQRGRAGFYSGWYHMNYGEDALNSSFENEPHLSDPESVRVVLVGYVKRKAQKAR